MRLKFAIFAAAFLAFAPLSARAQVRNASVESPLPKPTSQLPQPSPSGGLALSSGSVLSFMMHPLENGMALYLPSIATDPNSGVTYGVMPIWVLQSPTTQRIKYIHAPSLTYNDYFGWSPTYRLYYYPTTQSTLIFRVAYDSHEHEVFASYDNQEFLDDNIALSLLGQWNKDASQRFYGFGPQSPLSGQTNYTANYLRAQGSLGIPLDGDSPWKLFVENNFIGQKTTNGPIPGLASFKETYPAQFSDGRQNLNAWRMSLSYDSRDSVIAPTRGTLLQLYAAYSVKALTSGYDYDRYGINTSYLHDWHNDKAGVTAVQLQFEELKGHNVPFWALPSLGGKYSLRAYGDGRFVDNGMAVLNAEQRFTVYQAEMAGVKIQGQVAPFAGVGDVFDTLSDIQSEYFHPVVGAAFRAIAPPQVVGSIDVGVGQEGVAIFMDVNYSF